MVFLDLGTALYDVIAGGKTAEIDRIHVVGRDLIFNKAYGHDGGEKFTRLSNDPEAYVVGITWWNKNVGSAFMYWTVLKTLKVTWNDGTVEWIGNRWSAEERNPDGSWTWGDEHRFKRFVIRVGSWIDAMDVEWSNGAKSSAGGNGGNTRYEQNVGNGRLVGFHGRCASDVDMLGAIFRAS